MKKKIFIFLLTATSLFANAQVSFEKAYFINNSNQKINCLIKNAGWKNNPTEFYYKLSENSQQLLNNINNVKEFAFISGSKYIRHNVGIDRSSDNINKLSTVKTPEFKQELLFLKLLIGGKVNLYSYHDGELQRYFYKTDISDIEQLIFKKYKTLENQIKTNNRYKQQLLNNLKCQTISLADVQNINYKQNDLLKLFQKYNECSNVQSVNYIKRKKEDLFNLTIRPGISSASLNLENTSLNLSKINFDNELSLRFGLEAEFILPFNKNKWAFLIEPTYQYYKAEKKDVTYIQTETLTRSSDIIVDYASIEIPLSLRYYMFLNNESKLFFNLSFILDVPLSKTIDVVDTISIFFDDIEIASKPNFALGFGYNFKSNYSIEMRLGLNRDITNDIPNWLSNYTNTSLIFGYTLF